MISPTGNARQTRQGKFKQPPPLCQCRWCPPLALQSGQQFLSHQSKSNFPRLLLKFSLHRRIDAVLEMLFSGVAPSARVRERDRRIDAERQQLLFAVIAARQPPQLGAARLDQEIQPAAVGKLDRFATRLGIADGGIGMIFVFVVGIRTPAKNTIPTKIPTNRPAAGDYGSTAANKSSSIDLFYGGFGRSRTS